MDQASALPAASCERNPAAPRTSSSCSRSEDRSQTGAPPPARLDPQSAPHVAPSSRDPRPSSPALCSTQRDICCRIFTPAQPEYPAASVRDNCSGAYTHPIKPTSPRCHSAWQPNPGRRSTYRRGKSVQTTGTTSPHATRHLARPHKKQSLLLRARVVRLRGPTDQLEVLECAG